MLQARRTRPFKAPLVPVNRVVLATGLDLAERYFARAHRAACRREQCVFELEAIKTLSKTYRNAGLVPGGEA